MRLTPLLTEASMAKMREGFDLALIGDREQIERILSKGIPQRQDQ